MTKVIVVKVNIHDCQYGIFACVNASDIMQKQRLGRILRHKEPKIIIPYYVGTREEEIVNEMTKMYNPELIHKIYYNRYEDYTI